MNWSGSAKGDDRNAAQINPHLDTMHSSSGGHVLVDDFMNPRRRIGGGETQLLGQFTDSSLGCVLIEGKISAEEGVRVEQTQYYVGVGHCGNRASLVVADRTGVRTCRVRTDFQQTELVDTSQRASSCSDLD